MSTGRQFRRRAVLGAIGTGIVGIAGCTDALDFSRAGDNSENGATDDGDDGSGNDDEKAGKREQDWGEAIPTYPYREVGVDPLNPRPDPDVDNPVLTADDVAEFDARFVADPVGFVDEDGLWHMFFEAISDGRGRIAHAYSEDQGITWEYNQIVQEWRYHAAYPYVWKWDGNHYMIPQTTPTDRPVELFQANQFPTDWYTVAQLFDPSDYDHGVNDFALFRYDGRWWFLGGVNYDSLVIWHADELTGDWTYHEANPVVTDRPEGTRPGGRPLVFDDGRIIYFTHDNRRRYGNQVMANEIHELTTESFEDEILPASPLLSGTDELDEDGDPTWNALRMHQYDPWYLGKGEGWRCLVDGDGRGGDNWAIGIYRVME